MDMAAYYNANIVFLFSVWRLITNSERVRQWEWSHNNTFLCWSWLRTVFISMSLEASRQHCQIVSIRMWELIMKLFCQVMSEAHTYQAADGYCCHSTEWILFCKAINSVFSDQLVFLLMLMSNNVPRWSEVLFTGRNPFVFILKKRTKLHLIINDCVCIYLFLTFYSMSWKPVSQCRYSLNTSEDTCFS